ncbi:hypothetical protein J2X61_003078 [Bacillus sp. 3255]|nr:hypothetical protein [Bacillus sp. 3255]
MLQTMFRFPILYILITAASGVVLRGMALLPA